MTSYGWHVLDSRHGLRVPGVIRSHAVTSFDLGSATIGVSEIALGSLRYPEFFRNIHEDNNRLHVLLTDNGITSDVDARLTPGYYATPEDLAVELETQLNRHGSTGFRVRFEAVPVKGGGGDSWDAFKIGHDTGDLVLPSIASYGDFSREAAEVANWKTPENARDVAVGRSVRDVLGFSQTFSYSNVVADPPGYDPATNDLPNYVDTRDESMYRVATAPSRPDLGIGACVFLYLLETDPTYSEPAQGLENLTRDEQRALVANRVPLAILQVKSEDRYFEYPVAFPTQQWIDPQIDLPQQITLVWTHRDGSFLPRECGRWAALLRVTYRTPEPGDAGEIDDCCC